MKQILKLVFLLVIGQTAFAQAPSNYTNINGRYRWIAGMFDSTFHIPKGSTPSLRTGGSTNSGGLFYNTSDSSVYTYTGTQWIKLRGSINPSDTTNKYVTQVYKKSGSDSIFYVKGGVHTWAFNDSTGSPGGGGGGKVYYFNGGVSMGTFGGFTMYELGDTANTGAAANFTRSTTGNIANFITDPGKPGLLQIPAGVWSVDAWLSETGGGANHAEIWVEVEKWDGSTITTIATSPIEQITEGGTPNLYSWSVSIPTTSLTVTDRIIIQFYISNTNGKTVTLYTQNGYVGEVHTTFTTGIGAINGLTAPAQYLVTGTSGTDFNINSSTATHTFNLPTASATNRGALSTTDWSTFNNKIGGSLVSGYLTKATGTNTIDTSQIYQSSGLIGIGTNTPTLKLDVNGDVLINGLWAGRGSGNINTNAVLGRLAFNANTTGFQNVAVGNLTLYSNTTGSNNVAIGNSALSANTTANHNVAIGHNSMLSNTTGFQNVAVGIQSLGQNTTGESNTAIGTGALGSITTGYYNAAIGLASGRYITSGANNTTSNESVYLGYDTRASANGNTNEIVIGGSAQGNGSNSVTLGNASITKTILRSNVGIGTVTPDSALTVVNGAYFQRGVRMSGLPTGVGTKAVRINANGTLSVADTLANGISGTGTTNYIPKFTSSSAIGNSIIYNDATGVGVGTTSPSYTFHTISPNASIAAFRNSGAAIGQILVGNTVADLQLRVLASGDALIFSDVSKYLAFGTNGATERMRLDASGNLGIGTSAPSFALDVATATARIRVAPSTTTNYALFQATNAGNTAYLGLDNSTGGLSGTAYALNVYHNGAYPIVFSTSGTNRMWLDASGNLGLGNSSPSTFNQSVTAPHMVIGAGSNAAGVTLYSGTTNQSSLNFAIGTTTTQQYDGGLIYVPNAGSPYLGIRVNGGVERMRLDASGNLGLGVTPEAWTTFNPVLRIKNASTAGGGALASSGISNFRMFANAFYDGAYKYIGTGAATQYEQDGYHAWSTAPSGTAGTAITFTERMRITSGGNVGIGTTSPTTYTGFTTLALNNATNGGVLDFMNNGTVIGQINNTASDFNIGSITAVPFTFVTNGSERMRITSTGNVGIGTTSPSYKLDVQGATAQMQLKSSTGTNYALFRVNNTGGDFYFGRDNSAGGQLATGTNAYAAVINAQGAYPLQVAVNNNIAMTILNGGNVGIGTTSPQSLINTASTGQVQIGTASWPTNFVGKSNARTLIGNEGILVVWNEAAAAANNTAAIYLGAKGGGTNGATTIAGGAIEGIAESASTNAGALAFETNGGSGNAERMRITSAGNVGIGTTSPTALLNISGAGSSAKIQVESTTTQAGQVWFKNGSTSSTGFIVGLLGDTSGDGVIYHQDAKNITFYTTASERMRITSSGELLINTTSDAGDYKLQVKGTTYLNATAYNTKILELDANALRPTYLSAYNNGYDNGGLEIQRASTVGEFKFSNSSVTMLTMDLSGNSTFGGSIKTAAPSGGTAKPWKFGEAGVSVGGANTTAVKVEIDGVVYYLLTAYLPEPAPESAPKPKPEG